MSIPHIAPSIPINMDHQELHYLPELESKPYSLPRAPEALEVSEATETPIYKFRSKPSLNRWQIGGC